MNALVFLTAFAVSATSIPAAKRIAIRFGITAQPATLPVTPRKVPVFGGASIIAGTLAATAIFGQLHPWMFGVGMLFILGAIDDARPLLPNQKIAFQLIVIIAVVADSARFAFTPWPILDALIAVFWLLASSNAFNLIDGLDGLAAGIGMIASIVIAISGQLHGNMALVCSGLALCGALAGFLPYNFNPASIYMGDAGTLPIGFMLGFLALRAAGLAANSRLTVFIFPVLVVLVPLLDTAIVTVTRMATANPISRRGLDHLHHRLLSLGLTERQAVSLCWVLALLGAGAAVASNQLPHRYVVMILPFIVLAAAIVALFMMDLTFDSHPPVAADSRTSGIARFILDLGYKYRIAEAALDLALISGAYCGAHMLRLNFELDDKIAAEIAQSLPAVLIVTYGAFLIAGVYRGIWRYSGFPDALRLGWGSVLALVFMFIGSRFVPILHSGSILILYAILLFNMLVVTRFSFLAFRRGLMHLVSAGQRVLIVGAGETGSAAANFISTGHHRSHRVVGFIDDDLFKKGKLVEGEEVLGTPDDLEQIYLARPFTEVLIAGALSPERSALLALFAKKHQIPVRRFVIQMDHVGSAPVELTPKIVEPIIAVTEPRPIG
ncbi:MAG TPA: hypothetical protein VIX12_04530 [Candidatus Binataceae bacterium]